MIPRGLAAKLGYCNQAGVPHRTFVQGTAEAQTASGDASYIMITQVPVSMAGCELSMPTFLGPDGKRQVVLVPVQAVRQLQRRGIAFHLL
ncbi:hypothetical protein C2E21_1630 [Chlorella sorokiniana]|uniref:Uncharacterized protein n=1 Tax=Chlorella sorokiniana TaxID=3076 RepID=A0A2P6U0P0_CHLSO|nr:hypothetical protein C2E21_1630 [Chlorella sorokiniana]|eukprot:PRW59874.1 hypothetical protein C2E21_1630 [Chlorella sorokiniana]